MKLKREIKWVNKKDLIVPEKPDFNTILNKVVATKRRIAIRKTIFLFGSLLAISVLGYYLLSESPIIDSDVIELNNHQQESSIFQEKSRLSNDSSHLIIQEKEVREEDSLHEDVENEEPEELNNKAIVSKDAYKEIEQVETVEKEELRADNTDSDSNIIQTTKLDSTKRETTFFDSLSSYREAYPLVGFDSLYSYLTIATEIAGDETSADNIDVKIHFYIEMDGRPTEIRIVADLPDSTASSIEEIITEMPDWSPATVNGKSVRSKFIIPMTIVPHPVNGLKE